MGINTDDEIVSMLGNSGTREKGFTLLMDTYKERIYWHIRRLVVSHEDAEDILQETFINAYNYASSFRGKSRLYTWLYRIATNECIKLYRKKRALKGKKQVELNGKIADELKDYDLENSDSILVKFQQAILQLPQKQQIVFNLRYYDELSYEEMSEVLNSSVNTLKTNYHYATEKIKGYLKNQ
jgi:RNA polymerase sigma-70 factor, ECF subfamily